MVALLQNRLHEVAEICRRHQVERLEVFGSAAVEERFKQATSDIDFLVSFLPGADLGPWLTLYFDLHDELAQLLDRPVDLVMHSAIRNRFFRDQADLTRRIVYAASDSKVA